MERELIPPGWHRDISNERYHASGGIGSTSLKVILETAPSGFLYRQQQYKKPTVAMQLGTLVHEMVLEPEVAKEKYVKAPEFGDQRKTANKEAKAAFEAENEDKIPIAAADFERAERMSENVLSHPMASLFLDGSVNESSVYWWYKKEYDDDLDYNVMCKVRPDAISISHPGMLLDLKTTEDASFTGFSKQIHKYSYHLSAAMYLEGVNQCDELIDFTRAFLFTSFVFVAVEKEPPYNVALYELSKEDLRQGRVMFRKAVKAYQLAKQENFPGYPTEVRTIELPGYARNMHVV